MSAAASAPALPVRDDWQLPILGPVSRADVCKLAQPRITRTQFAPRFHFHGATLLYLATGILECNNGGSHLSVDAERSPQLLLIDPHTVADLVKTPAADSGEFRSILLEMPDTALTQFRQSHSRLQRTQTPDIAFRTVELHNDLSSMLLHVLKSAIDQSISDARMHYRVQELLLTLAEHGHTFAPAGRPRVTTQLREFISEAPERRWTAQDAAQLLLMSESTLRRKLAHEQTRFDELLVDVRMHHALMLLQTTDWTVPHVAAASGYRSRTRFSDRFRARFGYTPSTVR